MKQFNTESLSGARAYFTGFDNKSYINKSDEEKLKILERTLKILLLTKNKIVFGASHLKSNLAFETIEKNQEIFSSGIIIPALSDRHSGDLGRAIGNFSSYEKVDLYNSVFSQYWNAPYNIDTN